MRAEGVRTCLMSTEVQFFQMQRALEMGSGGGHPTVRPNAFELYTQKRSQLYICFLYFITIKKKYLFLERGEDREKERERNISVWLPLVYPQLGA